METFLHLRLELHKLGGTFNTAKLPGHAGVYPMAAADACAKACHALRPADTSAAVTPVADDIVSAGMADRSFGSVDRNNAAGIFPRRTWPYDVVSIFSSNLSPTDRLLTRTRVRVKLVRR